MAKSDYSRPAPDLEMVKNCVVWSLAQGEVARRINVSEFGNLSGARGVYVQEGVVAVLMIDGKVVTKLSSGVYYFPTAVERFNGAIRHIWRFFTGEKQVGSHNEFDVQNGRLGSELQNLGKNSLVDIILVIDGYIPIVLGMRQTEFYPYTVKTLKSTLDIGVSMKLEVTNFVRFRKNYLTQNRYCRIWDLQSLLLDPVGNVLQEIFAHEEVESSILPPLLKARTKDAIKSKVDGVLDGVSVADVLDITIKSDDFDRFHELEHKLYLTSKETDYLIRTNEFKNRLIAENNSQTLKEARSEEDLRYSLNLLNKDRLLHDDEMEDFCQLLASQKKIREAKTEADTDKALLEIKGNRLISEDDYEALVHELGKKKDARQEEEDILHLNSALRVKSLKFNVEKELSILAAKNAAVVEQAQFTFAKQQVDHKNELEKDAAEHTVVLNDIARGERKKDDDYSDYRREKEHVADVAEARDDMELYDEQETRGIKRNQLKNQIELEIKAKEAEIKRADKAQDYEYEEKMAQMRAENEQKLHQITAGMDASQIAATHIADLSDKAQEAMASAFSSVKENEWLNKSAEERVRIIQALADRSAQIDKENREQQERTLDKMMRFMTEAMKTNASVVSGGGKPQESVSDEKDADSDIVRYVIPEYGRSKRSFTDVVTMIHNKMVTPDTEIFVGAEKFRAYDLKEFRMILDRIYAAECPNPNCGRWGLKGHICPECGTMI